MTLHWDEVATVSFNGKRFDNHALDIPSLSELQHFQKMVTETHKAVWKKAHPGSGKLPANFEQVTRLHFRRINEGSATVPLETFTDQSAQPPLMELEPEALVQTLSLIYRVFEAAHHSRPLPRETPKELLAEYVQWGKKGLSNGETLGFALPGQRPTPITERERHWLTTFMDHPYEDELDITGRVLEADVRRKRFQFWMSDQEKVTVEFTEEQESEVTTALKEHDSVRLRVEGLGRFNPDGNIDRIIRVDSLTPEPEQEWIFDPATPRIEDRIVELFADVPDEEWENLPSDLIDNLDHYLYGADKK